MKTTNKIIKTLLGAVLLRRITIHLSLLAVLVTFLTGSAPPARAQSLDDSVEAIEAAFRALDHPYDTLLVARILVVERMLDRGNEDAAIRQLNLLADQLEAASSYGLPAEIIDDLVESIEQVIEDIVNPPAFIMWYIDQDGDGYTVPVGLFSSSSVPVPPLYDNPLNGFDCNDTCNDPDDPACFCP